MPAAMGETPARLWESAYTRMGPAVMNTRDDSGVAAVGLFIALVALLAMLMA